VREYHYGLLTAAALTCLTIQPALAASTQVKDISVQSNGNGIALMLTTADAQRELPQIFTINQGNALVADLLDTQLQLPSGETYVKQNPHPEIGSVEISQLDSNSVRIVVRGTNRPVDVDIQPPVGSQIALNFAPSTSTAQNRQVPTVPAGNSPIAQTPAPQPMPTEGQERGFEQVAPPTPEVLIPNPEITIDGVPAPAAGAARPISPAPPFLPRAIAPPVGDIAVSNIDSSPELIDLGTGALVPRVVLRDAPVREVLALLARSAGLNLIYTGAGVGAGEGVAAETTISLDLENEPVQEVFNYVLQLSNLQANRRGRSIFVGPTLPNAARNLVTRSLRLNQIEASAAATFLATQGAAVQIVEQLVEEIVDPETQRVVRTVDQPATIRSLTAVQPAAGEETLTAPLLLRGLTVSSDDRLNSVTLVGAPREVQIATSFLTQLDARRRQVAVNVKVVDVNLLNTEDINTSFSFGIGDSFFSVNNGNLTGNYGEFRPPTSTEVRGSLLGQPVIPNPFADAETFIDLNSDNAVFVPGTTPGRTILDEVNGVFEIGERGGREFLRRVTAIGDDPFNPQVINVTPAENFVVTRTIDEEGNITTTIEPGTEGEVESGLPSLFQYPNQFLASLEAQITNGNAKILTDPTLVVQEGQEATVSLTQEVVGNIISETVSSDNITTRTVTADIEQAGLTLTVAIEQIDDNGFISLSVAPTVTSIGNVQNISVGDDINQIALLNRRELSSGLIRLRDSQTLILSGIIQETDRTTVSKVPILGDLPILGALFRDTNRTNQRNEVIVLLTPQIIDDSERSTFGYNYTPGRATREVLQQRGFPIQGR
jgi:type IV pilus assembly protein PilQ